MTKERTRNNIARQPTPASAIVNEAKEQDKHQPHPNKPHPRDEYIKIDETDAKEIRIK